MRRLDLKRAACPDDFRQPGRKIAAAGYAIYGAKVTFVYSCGDGVHDFTLDPAIGEFVLIHDNLRIPESGRTFSVNEGNRELWDSAVRSYIDFLIASSTEAGPKYRSRYVGSLVADFDRNLRTGGVFLYPADRHMPSGKLRLLYECMPLAFVVEQAGGGATDGARSILDIVPENVHQRTPLVIGSRREVELFRRFAAHEDEEPRGREPSAHRPHAEQ